MHKEIHISGYLREETGRIVNGHKGDSASWIWQTSYISANHWI